MIIKNFKYQIMIWTDNPYERLRKVNMETIKLFHQYVKEHCKSFYVDFMRTEVIFYFEEEKDKQEYSKIYDIMRDAMDECFERKIDYTKLYYRWRC